MCVYTVILDVEGKKNKANNKGRPSLVILKESDQAVMLRYRGALLAGQAVARAVLAVSVRHSPKAVAVSRTAFSCTTPRCFSSGTDQFRETLEKMNKKSSETAEQGAEAEQAADEKRAGEPVVNSSSILKRTANFATDSYVLVKDNIRMAWDDLTGASKQTTLRRSVIQAESFRRGGEAREEDPEAERYEGPTAMVVVKDRGSAWDQMKARLSSSPLIREMLKNTKKVRGARNRVCITMKQSVITQAKEAAASTDIGKKAFEAGQNVKDKMEAFYTKLNYILF